MLAFVIFFLSRSQTKRLQIGSSFLVNNKRVIMKKSPIWNHLEILFIQNFSFLLSATQKLISYDNLITCCWRRNVHFLIAANYRNWFREKMFELKRRNLTLTSAHPQYHCIALKQPIRKIFCGNPIKITIKSSVVR